MKNHEEMGTRVKRILTLLLVLIFKIGFGIGVLIDPHFVFFLLFFSASYCACTEDEKSTNYHTKRRRLKINEIILQSGQRYG